jgi:hypothetical protein
MLDGKDMSAIDRRTKLVLIPICVGIVDTNKSGDFWGRRVSKSVARVTTVDTIVESSREGHEETEDGLLNAGSIRFCKGVELRHSTRRAITTVA